MEIPMQIVLDFIIFFGSTFFGGVLGYLLKTQIDHRLAIARNYETIRATEFNKGATEFRIAFVDVVYSLRKNSVKVHELATDIVNQNVMVAHEKAKIRFEPYIPCDCISGFNAAWDDYKKCKANYYSTKDETLNIRGDAAQMELSAIYLTHIEKLLSYAEPKIDN